MLVSKLAVAWQLVVVICLILSLQACDYIPPPRPGKDPQPIAVPLEELALTTAELPNLGVAGWYDSSPLNVGEEWAVSGAVDAVVVHHKHRGKGATVVQTIVRLADVEDASLTWRRLKDSRIEEYYTRFDIVPILSENELPYLHADQIVTRCEDYGDDVIRCAIRLQYESIYTEVKASFTLNRVTQEQFYEIVEEVDERMKPIWSDVAQE